MSDEISLIPGEYKGKKRIISTLISKWSVLVIILIMLSLLIYGGLIFYKKELEKDLSSFQDVVDELNKKRDKDFEERAMSLDGALKDLKVILKNHVYWSDLFSKLETLTVPEVVFSEFDSALEKDGSIKTELKGQTAGYTYLAKQIRSFEQEQVISGVEIEKISLGTEGGIEFNMTVIFEKDVLLKE